MYKSHTWPIYSVGSTCREPSVNNVPQRATTCPSNSSASSPHHGWAKHGRKSSKDHLNRRKNRFFLLLFVSVPRDFSAISNHPAPTFQASGSGSGFNSTVEIPMSSSAAFFNKHSTDPSHLDAGKARAKWELPNQPRITRPGKHTKNYGKIHHL